MICVFSLVIHVSSRYIWVTDKWWEFLHFVLTLAMLSIGFHSPSSFKMSKHYYCECLSVCCLWIKSFNVTLYLFNNNNNNNQRQCLWCCPHDRGHCESSPGLFDECSLSARWPPTLRPSQPTWAVSPPISDCYHPHPPSPFVIITQPKSWYSFYRPTEGGRLSRSVRSCKKGFVLAYYICASWQYQCK